MFTKLMVFFLGLNFLISSALAKGGEDMTLETVEKVELEKYLGDWYEIARFTIFWERNCVGAMAHYSLKKNGMIKVRNTCFKHTLDGKFKTSIGKAKIVDTKSNSKLKVSFFGPFYAPYWIIDLGANYEYAVVGNPDRTNLWILSRTPELEQSVLDGIIARAKAKGFDTDKLEFPPQKLQN